MSEDKKITEDALKDENYKSLTAPGWLERVDEDLEALHKSPFELEEKRKLTVESALLAAAIGHLREAVMSLSMEVAHLKNMAKTKEVVAPAGGKKSMGRVKS